MIIRILITLLLLSAPSSLLADKTTDKAVRDIQTKMKSIDYLAVQFTNTIYSSFRKTNRTVTGMAYFAKPRKFRWIKQTPMKEEIVYDGKDVYIYKPDEKVAEKFSSIAHAAKEIEKLSNMVLSVKKLLNHYNVQSATYEKGRNILNLSLLPKKASDLESVQLKISLQRKYVKTVKLLYKEGNRWTFDFKNPRTSVIPPERFQFIKPKDVKLSVL